MKQVTLILTASFAFFLNGCASLKIPETSHTVDNTLSNHTAPNKHSFHASGAMAAKNQQHAWTATFSWTQQGPNDYHISLNGPLATSGIEISMHQGILTYHEGHKVVHSNQPEALLAKETGIRIPVGYLYDWIRGKPAPVTIDTVVKDANQDIITLRQGGFVLSYSDYHEHYPHKIRLEGHQLLIKIVIHSWS